MVEILLIMLSGILAGYLLRKRSGIAAFLDKCILWAIYLLLFLMGLSIGRDPLIMASLPSLGMTALAISLSAISGSLIAAFLLWRFVFNKRGSTH